MFFDWSENDTQDAAVTAYVRRLTDACLAGQVSP
jgi:hypothetical protein